MNYEYKCPEVIKQMEKDYPHMNAETASFRQRENDAIMQYQYKWKVPPMNGLNNRKLPEGLYGT